MKARGQQALWPLRPIPTLWRFELACWLAAAILALALTLAAAPGSKAAATAPPPPAHPVVYRANCIERILARAADKTEEVVANQIIQQCRTAGSNQPSSAAGLAPLACGRPFTAGLAPVARRVAGCLGG
jgi:hypothetical protein